MQPHSSRFIQNVIRSTKRSERRIMVGTIRPKGLTSVHMYQANIGEDYWSCNFANFEGPLKAREVSKKYLDNLGEMKEKGIGLLYVGPNGPGKTTLAMIVMKYLVRAGWNIYCTSLGEVVENIQRGWGNQDDGEASEFIRRCREADFLLIDDVGKEHRGRTGFVQTVFDNLIRFRVQHRKPTFLTTNFTKSELENTYGESAMSLLEGKVLPITVDGKDHRRTILKSEARALLK